VTVLGAKERGVDNNVDHNLRMKGTSYADSSVVTWNTDPPDHLDHAAAPLSADTAVLPDGRCGGTNKLIDVNVSDDNEKIATEEEWYPDHAALNATNDQSKAIRPTPD